MERINDNALSILNLEDDIMNLLKSEDDHFFLQLDSDDCDTSVLKVIKVEEHTGDQTKHLPIIENKDKTVRVKIGNVMHPMTNEHHISMIYLKTNQGGQFKILSGLQAPIVSFELSENDVPLEVYGYCNLHGLWKETI